MSIKLNIKDLLNKWKLSLKDNLKKKDYQLKEKEIELYIIPRDWENREYIHILKLWTFNHNISKDNGQTIIPNADFSIIQDKYIELKIEALKRKAKYSTNKLVVDLGNDNYYFYYLDKDDNICEGYTEYLKSNNVEDNFVENFNNKKMEDFISLFLKDKRYEIKNNNKTFFLSNDRITFKNNKDLINSLKEKSKDISKEKGNSNLNGNIKKVSTFKKRDSLVNNNIDGIDEDKKEIIKCFIFYYNSDLELEDLKKDYNKNRIYHQFYPINKEWIKLFREKYNFDRIKNLIKNYDININNYLEKMNYFQFIIDIEKKPINSLCYKKVRYNNIEYKIYDDYELINSKAYDLFNKYFGENNQIINQLDIINVDDKYILVKYNNNCFEIMKKKTKESERYLIIRKNNLGNEILEDLLKIGFDNWIKNKNIKLNDLSNNIYEGDKIIGKILKINEIKVDEIKLNDDECKKINLEEKRTNRKEDNNIVEKNKIVNREFENKKDEEKTKKKIQNFKRYGRTKTEEKFNTKFKNLQKNRIIKEYLKKNENKEQSEDNYEDNKEEEQEYCVNTEKPNGLIGLQMLEQLAI